LVDKNEGKGSTFLYGHRGLILKDAGHLGSSALWALRKLPLSSLDLIEYSQLLKAAPCIEGMRKEDSRHSSGCGLCSYLVVRPNKALLKMTPIGQFEMKFHFKVREHPSSVSCLCYRSLGSNVETVHVLMQIKDLM
jgi:hypothetical protein